MDGDKNPLVESEELANKNLWLWRINEQTDPAHTKPVKLGRSFTAIDPHYQVKRATETFGPVGQGWGWDLTDEVITVPGKDGEVALMKCTVTLWYVTDGPDGNKEMHHCGPVIGMNLLTTGGRVDEDAGKKAVTDALTKGLSYLGFSADVFMGLYDDSRYVDTLRKQMNQKAEATGQRLPEVITKALGSLPTLNDLAELNITWKALQPDLRQLSAPALDFVKNRFAMRRRQLAPGPEQDDTPPDAAA
jgi:hypothetical protein